MKKVMDKKKLARVIATWLVTGIMVSVFLLDIVTVVFANNYTSAVTLTSGKSEKSDSADRIHFLNTANSDCIILESNGRFAMIDSGEGDTNPRKKTEYKGFTEEVMAYLEEHAMSSDGKIHLDFILATHMHYDHAGNFENIIRSEKVVIDKAYIKEYTDDDFSETEKIGWGNQELYTAIITALNEKEVPIIHDLPTEEFTFGDFNLRLLNTVTPDEIKVGGDNDNSIGVIVKKGEDSAFLAADFTNSNGIEEYYADDIGDIDLLKMGHHGYFGSSSADFLRTLNPEIAICTNYIGKIYPNVKWNITMVAKAPIFSTVHRNGIIATFTGNGITLTENIM